MLALADAAAGGSVVVRERQAAPGVRELTFAPFGAAEGGRARNPPPPEEMTRRVSMGREFFRTPLKTYRDWQTAWWREAIQNAVDAGARMVSLAVSPEADGSVRVSAEDDGGGMDLDTLIGRFLALGGTGKGEAGSVGGFGKAKELLILPWIGWEVWTRDVVVRGAGGDYAEPERVQAVPGTRITVWMDSEECTTAAHAQAYVRRCHLPHVRFEVNSELVLAASAPGEVVREFQAAADVSLTVHHDPAAEPAEYMAVRAAGLHMFGEYVGDKIPGRLVCELHGRSYDVLTDNRDGFADWRLRQQVGEFGREIAVDVLTALRVKKGLTKTVYRNRGLLEVRDELAWRLLSSAPTLRPRAKPDKEAGEAEELDAQTLDPAAVRTMVGIVQAAAGGRDESMATIVPPEAVAVHLEQGFRSQAEVEAALRALAWAPDVYVVNEVEGFRPPASWIPGPKMGRGPARLLRLWAEFCRMVLIGMGEHRPFGVGWVFSLDISGEYRAERMQDIDETQDWLLYNPFVLDRRGPKVEVRPRVRLSDEETVARMFATAMHEVAHLISWEGGHNELYAQALTKIAGVMAPRWTIVRKLRTAVGRAQAGDPAEARGGAPDVHGLLSDARRMLDGGASIHETGLFIRRGFRGMSPSVAARLASELQAGAHPGKLAASVRGW